MIYFLNKAQGLSFCRDNFLITFIEHLHTALLKYIYNYFYLHCYKKALSIEEPNFIKEIRSIEESDIHRHALIQEVLNSWEKRVTKVASQVSYRREDGSLWEVN